MQFDDDSKVKEDYAEFVTIRDESELDKVEREELNEKRRRVLGL